MQKGDLYPAAMGTWDELPDRLVGHRVLGVRDGPDIVMTPRKRKASNPPKS